MMKRRWMLLLLCLCLLPLMGLAEAVDGFTPDMVPQDLPRPTEWSYQSPSQVILAGNAFYVLYCNEQTILRWQPGDTQATVFSQLPQVKGEGPYAERPQAERAQLDEAAHLLFEAGGKPHAFNLFTGLTGEVTPEGVRWGEVKLDLGGALAGSDIFYQITTAFAQGDRLVLSADGYAEQTMADQQDVTVFDLQSGKALRPKLALVKDIAPYKPGQALLLRQVEVSGTKLNQLSTLSLTDGSVQDLPLSLPASGLKQVGGLAWDSERDIIYLADENRVYLSRAGGPLTAGTILPSEYFRAGRAQVLPDGRYALLGDMLRVVPVAEGGDEGYIKLALRGGRGQGALDAYRKANPDAKVMLTEQNMQPADVVAEMLAQPEAYDIYELAVDSNFAALLDKNYAAPLDGDAAIARAVGDMYPWAQAALRDSQGVLRAVPGSLGIDRWSANLTMFHRHFPDEPLPDTYGQLMDLFIRFEQGADEHPEDTFMSSWRGYPDFVRTTVWDYIEQHDTPDAPLSFDSQSLREALEKLKQARDIRKGKGLSLEPIEYNVDSGSEEPTIFFPQTAGDNVLDNRARYSAAFTDFAMMPVPRFEKDAPMANRGRMTALVLNPHSTNPQGAMDYLRFVLTREAAPAVYILLHPTADEPVPNPRFDEQMALAREQLTAAKGAMESAQGAESTEWERQVAYYQEVLDKPELAQWAVTPQAIADYRAFADTVRLYDRSPYVSFDRQSPAAKQVDSLTERYVQDQLTLDDYLKALGDTFRLIYLEQK
jgi:hypothetical protein